MERLQKRITEVKTNVKQSLLNLIEMLDFEIPKEVDNNFAESVKLFFILEENLTNIITYLHDEKQKYIKLENESGLKSNYIPKSERKNNE